MDAFRIRTEHLPARCEICHQADLFDPETGECARCAGISVSATIATMASGEVWNPNRLRNRFLRLKVIQILFVLFGTGSIWLFLATVWGDPLASANAQTLMFRQPVLGLTGPKPKFQVDDKELKITGMLSEAEETAGVRLGWMKGEIVESGTEATFDGHRGWCFKVRSEGKILACFCPGDHPIPFQWFENRFVSGNFVCLAGQYDTSLDVLFVSRIIIRETPFRGDELPQS